MKPYYQDKYCVIYHGDCREILPQLAPVDLILTDPPYGIGEAAGKNKSRGKLAVSRDYGNLCWDDYPPSDWLFGLIREKAKHQIIFGGNFFPLPPSRCWLVWDKDNGASDFADCELAWTNLERAVRYKRYRWNGMLQEPGRKKNHREHPTQKPLEVISWCISLAPEPKSIIDPFMGSGTTLRAAKDLQIAAVGIEREEKYCEIAAKRLQQEVLPLLTPTPASEERK